MHSGLHWFLQRLLLETGYRIVHPLLARLPARMGMAGARAWGTLMARFDCEWRSVALRTHYVRDRTRAAFLDIAPTADDELIQAWLCERFVCAAQEELEGHWLAMGLKSELPVRIVGIDALRAALDRGRGLVLLTFHYDAAIWGIACLGRAGLRLSPMSSQITEDTRVPAVVRAYFRRKYAGLSRCLQGGAVMHFERHLARFYRCLERGEGVVLLADASAQDPANALAVDFLGRRRLFASGALRLARRSGAAVAAFVCRRDEGGYLVEISPPLDARQDAAAAVRAALAFLEAQVRALPQRWWAADLLPNFATLSGDEADGLHLHP